MCIRDSGDDVYLLYLGAATLDGSDATLVDIVGVIGTDGTGEPWEYLDTWMVRNSGVLVGNTTWTQSEWTQGAVNALDDADAQGHADVSSLTHNCTAQN